VIPFSLGDGGRESGDQRAARNVVWLAAWTLAWTATLAVAKFGPSVLPVAFRIAKVFEMKIEQVFVYEQ
jgi:hypothetical protein